jgi:hypothetical protein
MNRATTYHRSDKIIKIRPTQLPADLSETRTHGSLELLSLRRKEREREKMKKRKMKTTRIHKKKRKKKIKRK